MIIRIDNALVWSKGELRSLSIVIEGSKIAALVDPGYAQAIVADQVIDAGGLWILPGGVDLHVHISDGIESFYPGSCCAAAGGITTVLDMAPFHTCVSVDQLRQKALAAGIRCVVDFGLVAGIVIENRDLQYMADLACAGAAYCKVFQPSRPPVTTETLWKSVQTAAHTGLRMALHAEDTAFLQAALDENDPLSFPRSRPPVAETSVVARLVEMARCAGAPVHICHISTGRTAELVAWGKAHGVDITCEVPPQYLLLDESAFAVYGARVKTTPPLRSKADCDQLWQALSEGVIDAIACDHYLASLIPPSDQPQAIPGAAAGIAGLELSLPLVMDAVLEGRLNLKRFVEAAVETPAVLAGISDRKGFLIPGMDADLTMWDPQAHWEVMRHAEFSRVSTTPFVAWNLRGRLVQTWVRGEPVWDGKTIQKNPGFGQWVISRRGDEYG